MTDQSPRTITRADPQKYQRLLDTAADQFARVGFDRANIDAIALRAGVGKGTVYLYFESKATLFRAVLVQVRHRLETTLTLNPGADAAVALRALICAHLQLADAAPDLFRCYTSALFGVNRDFQDTALTIFLWQQDALRALLGQVDPSATAEQLDARAALLAGSLLAAGLVRGLRHVSNRSTELEETALLHGYLGPLPSRQAPA